MNDELFTSTYLDTICRNDVTAALESNRGSASVEDLARDLFRLPVEYTLVLLRGRTTGGEGVGMVMEGVELIQGGNGGIRLVTEGYQEGKRMEVMDVLSRVTVPTLSSINARRSSLTI